MDQQSLETIAILNAENEYMEMENEEEMETEEQAQSVTHTTESTQAAVTTQRARAQRAQRPQQAGQVRKKRTTSKSAKCWKEFTSVGVEANGRERAQCHHCGIKMVIGQTETGQSLGTSHLSRHLLICPEKLETDRPKYDHKIDREMTAEIIIYHDLPFRYVEYEKVRARDKFLNPDCVHICRQTAAADVYKKYEVEKVKLKEVLAKYHGRMCFTSDLWSARSQVMGYICLTGHYIDDDWKLNNHILAFCDLKPPHTGEAIAKKVYDILKEWGLERKVFSITLDNASANDNMQKNLTHRLQSGNGLLCEGKFLHVRCCAHILNLIVKKGLELASSLLENIRNSVKFVKASESRLESFAACVESVGIRSAAGLSLDVETRWNSTYEMLVRALKFRKAFANLHMYDRNYKSLPSEEEWDRGEKIRDFLKPFSTITTYFSGVKYPTANVYFIQVWKIELLLRKYARCNDRDVRLMAMDMQSKFAKYWDEYSVVLAMGAALDPRFKLEMLKVAYDKVDPSTSEAKVQIVRENLELLYNEYTAKSSESSSKFPTKQTPLELLTESPLDDDLDDVSIWC